MPPQSFRRSSSSRRHIYRSGIRTMPPMMMMVALLLLAVFASFISSSSSSSSRAIVVSAAAESTTTSSSSSSSTKKQGVVTLNSRNFDSSLKDGNVWLIEFYAPWCGHCTRFASTYESVANQLHAKRDNPADANKRRVSVAKVDGAAERALSSRFGVHSFPTFFLVDGWTVRQYEGGRSLEGLIKFATENYEETEPVPFLFGPFGPMGQLRSALMRSGTWAVGLYENLTEVRGMKPLVAMACLCVGGLVMGLVSIVVVGLMFLPKAKQD